MAGWSHTADPILVLQDLYFLVMITVWHVKCPSVWFSIWCIQSLKSSCFYYTVILILLYVIFKSFGCFLCVLCHSHLPPSGSVHPKPELCRQNVYKVILKGTDECWRSGGYRRPFNQLDVCTLLHHPLLSLLPFPSPSLPNTPHIPSHFPPQCIQKCLSCPIKRRVSSHHSELSSLMLSIILSVPSQPEIHLPAGTNPPVLPPPYC